MHREKRVTRISRQRLRGLIEEAVENVINEGLLLENSGDNLGNTNYDYLYKKCKEAFVPNSVLTDIVKECDEYGIRLTRCLPNPLYTSDGLLWGYAIGIDTSNNAFYHAKSNSEKERLGDVFKSILFSVGFNNVISLPQSNGSYQYAYTMDKNIYIYEDSALSIEDIKRETGLL